MRPRSKTTKLILLDSLLQETCKSTGNHHQHSSCLPSLVSLSLPASPWPPCAPCAPLPCRPCTPPPPRLTSTLLPSSSEPELPPLESLDQELELDPFSDLSSSDTPGTLPSSSSCSPTLFWDLLFPRPWVCSA